MSFVVVQVKEYPHPGEPRVRTFGPFATAEDAEQARRRRHLDNVLEDAWNTPNTYVTEIEPEVTR